MHTASPFRITLLKPSKYENGPQGAVERFRRGFMSNSTPRHIAALTPPNVGGRPVTITIVDEYTETDLRYLDRLTPDACALLALVGVQSNQWHRALDLAAVARHRGVPHVVIGGPHAMTCRTDDIEGRGLSVAIAEAEMVWKQILTDAIRGELQPRYGDDGRWQAELDAVVLTPPTPQEMRRYIVPMLGVYPARGCPYDCTFCSVTRFAGKKVRVQPFDATLETLQRAKRAGVQMIMFVSDNFNKIPGVRELLQTIIDERVDLPFFVQCDVQIADDEEFVELLARAGCYMLFDGVESFNRHVLKAAHKNQNHPAKYGTIVRFCNRYGIAAHFSNIIGFPQDTEAGVREHLRELELVNPDAASFYILTPIPGTEQYDDFRKAGIITAQNLDRFDATCVTWEHPHLSPRKLQELLCWCYQEHHRIPRLLGRVLSPHWAKKRWYPRWQYLLGALFSRWTAWRGTHPMSGGIGRKRIDDVRQYLPLRKATYGFTHAPLPENRALSPKDQLLVRGIPISSS